MRNGSTTLIQGMLCASLDWIPSNSASIGCWRDDDPPLARFAWVIVEEREAKRFGVVLDRLVIIGDDERHEREVLHFPGLRDSAKWKSEMCMPSRR